MTEQSHAGTLPDLFAATIRTTRLSWFANDLSPTPDWSVPHTDSSGWCVLDGPAIHQHVLTLAAGLIDAGVAQGDRVALMMSNRPEHWMADLAVLHAGGVPSTFYPTLAPEQVRSQAAHVGITTAIVEGSAQFEQWSRALPLPELRRVIVLDPTVRLEMPEVAHQSYSQTLRRGAELLLHRSQALLKRTWRIRPDDPATIIFTSGTTGAPKAVPLSHRNLLAVVCDTEEAGNIPAPYRTVSYLPTAHIVDRIVSIYLTLLLGGEVSFSPTQEALNRVISHCRPTTFVGVPRIWEKLLARLERLGHEHVGRNPLTLAGFDQLEMAITAGAPMPPDVAGRLRDLGVPLVDVWGMTEAAGMICLSKVDEVRPGTVGKGLPGSEIRVASDGELLVRGRQVSSGYLQPDGTTTAITDPAGWLPTGDIGSIDADGYVRIVDRKKEIIITSGGKNISPVAIESLLTRSPLIAQALAFGDGRPYVVALLTLDPQSVGRWLREQHGIDATATTVQALAAHPHVRVQVSRDVDQANNALARVEQIKNWHLLSEPWSVEQGTLTPSLKLCRPAIHQRHHDELDALYQQRSDAAKLPGLDLSRLQRFLARQCPGLVSGPLSGTLIEGGRSNLTYAVSDGTDKLVIRRPPLGHVLPTAHDMSREHAILKALAETAIPVPRPLALCTDDTVVGAPFYVMEFIAGTTYRSDAQLARLGAERIRGIGDNLVDLLVDLHALDPVAVGLAALGRSDGYLARQLRRWKAQLDSSRSRDVPDLDALGNRLAAAIPESGTAAIVHGDYRLDNVLVEDDRITAVLDWEMSTLGDPLTDLALLIAYTRTAAAGLGIGVGTAPGYPSGVEITERYARRAGRDVAALPWYLAFAFFKLAVIAEGIHYRFTNGQTVGAGFEHAGASVAPLIALANDAFEAER
jgi:long-subunit acyl-CoA synthetase (AMP-forming)/aminoglycoside phosphotransferase (APT) family kinase protein